jgi:hypothetical protein
MRDPVLSGAYLSRRTPKDHPLRLLPGLLPLLQSSELRLRKSSIGFGAVLGSFDSMLKWRMNLYFGSNWLALGNDRRWCIPPVHWIDFEGQERVDLTCSPRRLRTAAMGALPPAKSEIRRPLRRGVLWSYIDRHGSTPAILWAAAKRQGFTASTPRRKC